MIENCLDRKLRAIFSADVKGYSRLMGEDEEYTVRTITAYRETISDLISKHKGRLVDSPGDNILAEFASALNAVNSAIEIQETIKKKNADLPDNRKMEFRIGINIGDIIHEGDRIYGDGVNVAARTESLADPGGVCISRNVCDQVKKKLTNLGYEYIGAQDVKNISELVQVYKVLTEPEYAGKVIGEEIPTPARLHKVSVALNVLVIVSCSLVVWNFYIRRPTMETASVEKMAYQLPDKPSIAVLPFDNLSENPKQDYFSDGITKEIISSLSKITNLFVIARNSTFTYKGKPVKVQQVAEELGVRYVLEGSVRKSGDKVRITAQLIDALSGNHLWEEQYDRDLKDIFAVQDDIIKNITTAMQVKLTKREQARSAAKSTNNLEAYLKCLQATEYITRLNPESNALGEQLAKEAIALNPNYAWAYYTLGRAEMTAVRIGTKSPKQALPKAMKHLQKAIDLDDTLSEPHGRLGLLYSTIGQYDKAVAEAEKAVALNPNSALDHVMLGKTLVFDGRWEESIPVYKKGIRLNPIPPNLYLYSLGFSYGMTGQYDEAITWCKKAIHKEPNSLFARLMMTAVYSYSGRDEEARKQAAEVLRIQPKFTLTKFEKTLKYKNKSDVDRFIGGLRKAGLK
jgi:adenylate cyclase